MFLNDPFGLNKEPSPTSIKNTNNPQNSSPCATYFIHSARNISSLQRVIFRAESAHLRLNKLRHFTSTRKNCTPTPPPPYLTDPTTQKNHPSPTLFNKPLQRKRITLLYPIQQTRQHNRITLPYPTTFCLHNYIPLTYSPPPLTPSQLTSPYFHSNTINTFTTHFTLPLLQHSFHCLNL